MTTTRTNEETIRRLNTGIAVTGGSVFVKARTASGKLDLSYEINAMHQHSGNMLLVTASRIRKPGQPGEWYGKTKPTVLCIDTIQFRSAA